MGVCARTHAHTYTVLQGRYCRQRRTEEDGVYNQWCLCSALVLCCLLSTLKVANLPDIPNELDVTSQLNTVRTQELSFLHRCNKAKNTTLHVSPSNHMHQDYFSITSMACFARLDFQLCWYMCMYLYTCRSHSVRVFKWCPEAQMSTEVILKWLLGERPHSPARSHVWIISVLVREEPSLAELWWNGLQLCALKIVIFIKM